MPRTVQSTKTNWTSDRVPRSNAAANEPQQARRVWRAGQRRRQAELIPQGIGGVWDPGSARRMRVRLWTAFFNETALHLLGNVVCQDGHHMNIWLGPEERQYVQALAGLLGLPGRGSGPLPATLSGEELPACTAAGLGFRRAHRRLPPSGRLRHLRTGRPHAASPRVGQHVLEPRPRPKLHDVIQAPRSCPAGRGSWYRPPRRQHPLAWGPAGREIDVPVPAFGEDLALLDGDVPGTRCDGDGKPNDMDEDDDNDGVADLRDAFPLEREETVDADRDLIGDSLDADADGDGTAKPTTGTQRQARHEEPDLDGDGFPTASGPWDAFPADPREWCDRTATALAITRPGRGRRRLDK